MSSMSQSSAKSAVLRYLGGFLAVVCLLALAWFQFWRDVRGWEPLAASIYKVNYDNLTTVKPIQWQGQPGSNRDTEIKNFVSQVEGTLLWETFVAREGRQAIVLRFKDVTAFMKQKDGPMAVEPSSLEESLKRGVTFIRDKQGLLESVSQPTQDIDRTTIGILAEILSMSEIENKGSSQNWIRQESDLFGPYEVTFTRDSLGKALSKSKKVYTGAKGSVKPDIIDPLYSQLQEVRAELAISFHGFGAKQGLFQSAEGTQSTWVLVSGQEIMHSSTSLQLDYLRQEAPSASSDAEVRREQTFVSLADFAQYAVQEEATKVSFDEVTAGLESFTSHRDVRDESKFVLKVRDFLRQKPDQASSVIELLDGYEVGSKEYMALLQGLLMSQKPEVQKAILEHIDNKKALGSAHVLLVAHLAEFEQPSEQLIEALSNYAESSEAELRSTSILALGSVAANLERDRHNEAQKLFFELKEKLDATADLNEKSTVWGALGNYGGTQVWDLVQQEYGNTPTGLRHRLVNALRLVSGEEVRRFLLEAAVSGENESIRLSGVSALTFRRVSEETISTLGAALGKETSPQVLSSILSYLTQHSNEFEVAGRVVEDFLRNNPESEVSKAYRAQFGRQEF